MNFSHYLEVTFLGFPDFAPRIPAPEVLVTAGTILSKMMKGTSADIHGPCSPAAWSAVTCPSWLMQQA